MDKSNAKGLANGLDGIVVAETQLSDVDGERGQLTIAGYDVEDLAGITPFEGAYHLLCGKNRDDAQPALAAGRMAAYQRLSSLGDALHLADGMDALRASMAQLSYDHKEVANAARSQPFSEADLVIGGAAVFAAAWARHQAGLPVVAPDRNLPHAADYLRMVTGEIPSAARIDGLDTYLVTVSDHGMNASTFTARVVASTGSDLVSSVVAAIGALKGPLHGGAPGPVLDMLDAIGTPDRAASFLEAELVAGRRIMGMGHRIYRVRDPRALVLERATQRLEQAGFGLSGRLPLARAVEQAALGVLAKRYPDRPLAANVEFYTAVLLSTLGLPRSLFSPTFAVGRVLGWCAHVAEQRATGRLIRPASRYVGPRYSPMTLTGPKDDKRS